MTMDRDRSGRVGPVAGGLDRRCEFGSRRGARRPSHRHELPPEIDPHATDNLAFIVPLVLLLLMVSDKRVLGRMGRWNRANSPWVKAGLALAVIAMSFGLMVSM
jgi:hypothetical protein